MKIYEAGLRGVKVIEPQIFRDARGLFLEMYQYERYSEAGIAVKFLQDNFSTSVSGVIRGLHVQSPRPQGKLVTVTRGSVLDIILDVRLGSATYGQHITIELSQANRRQIWIPRGLAHGFVTTSDEADFYYKCDEYYDPVCEHTIKWDDPDLRIDYGIKNPIVSVRDQQGKRLSELKHLMPQFENT